MYTKVFSYMTEVLCCLYTRNGLACNTAQVYFSDLEWYINTGRASTDWLNHLLKAKPYMVARRIAKGGSTNEIVKRVTDYIYGNEGVKRNGYEYLSY